MKLPMATGDALSSSNVLPISNARVERSTGTEDESLLHQIGILRLSVWQASGTIIDLPKETISWQDFPEDSSGLHFVVFRGSELIAATRLNVYEKFSDMPGYDWMDARTEEPLPPVAVIGRLVVAPPYQRLGLGKFLDTECLFEAIQRGCNSVICDVPPYRVHPLEKLGFRVIQPPKMGVTLPEISWTVMYAELKDNNSLDGSATRERF